MTFRRTCLGAAFLVAALALSSTPAAQSRRTAADFVSPAFPFGLVSADTTDRLAWISYDEGKRNVFTAAGPDFKPVRLTSFMDDDGVDLTDLSLSADGSVAVFVRGHARNRDGWVANPLSNAAGTERAIWGVRTSGGAPFRLAEINTGAPVLSPDGKHALYVKDGQIYRAAVVSTPATTAKDRGEEPYITVFGNNGTPRWSPDSTRFAFVSNRTDHAFVGIYELASRKITWVAPDVDRDSSPTWSPDGNRLAFIRRPGLPFGQQQQGTGRQGGAGIGASASAGQGAATGLQIPGLFRAEFRGGGTLAFWVADARTGEAREFWRHDPAGTTFRNINAIQWAGQHVVFTTQMPNDEYDRYFSVALDGSSKEPVMLTTTDGIIEDASSINVSQDGKTLFYTTNHGDIDRRDIFAVATSGGTPRQVTETPAIETQPVPLPSGKVAMLYADARVPQSVGVVPATGGKANVIYPTLPARYPLAAHVEPTNVTLEAEDGVKFNNQLFLPRDIKPGEKRPAMVFVHGGPQRQMLLGYHYRHVYHMFYGINQWLADKGYIVLSVNYRRGVGYGRSFRMAPNSGGSGNAEYLDVLAAGKYLHSREDVDTKRVAIWGLSYGGVLTAQALARNSDLFSAGIDLAGVHLWGNSLDPESLSFKSSVIGAIDGWKSPVLLQHGDDDRNVAFTQTTGLVQMLRARNIEYELIVFPDDVHDSLVHSRWIYIFDRMEAFLEKHIGPWKVQTSGVNVTFRGVSAVDAHTAWVSGSRGTVLRTTDAGVTWANVSPAGAEKLDIRDVDAIDPQTAYALSIGNGDQSRIFKTTDGGKSWATQFVSPDADAFFDAMAFWNADRGLAFSDSAGGQHRLLTTTDGGRTWSRVAPASLPPALDNEGAFAASGTNVAVWGSQHAWVGTGAAATARVLRTTDGGRTWAVSNTPLAAGPTSGIYSIAFRDALHGIVVGGDYSKEADAVDNVAVTSDGGRTWTLTRGLGGFRSVVTPLPGGTGRGWIALGPSGADRTEDDGMTWTPVEVPVRGLHTFSLARSGEVGWAAGGRGQIAKWNTQ